MVDRPERKESIQSQDWLLPVTFVEAIISEHPTPRYTVRACTLSHLKAMEMHVSQFGEEPFLILEDDARLVDVDAYSKLLEATPHGWTNLGSQPTGKESHNYKAPFFRTHAMLCGGMTQDQIPTKDSQEIIGCFKERDNTEFLYWKSFGVTLLDTVIVDFKPFVSDRDFNIQKPLLSHD